MKENDVIWAMTILTLISLGVWNYLNSKLIDNIDKRLDELEKKTI